jgi:hypothetical protein
MSGKPTCKDETSLWEEKHMKFLTTTVVALTLSVSAGAVGV